MAEDDELPQRPRRSQEEREVRHWRRDEALEAGLTPVEADLFADSDESLATLRKCVSGGATPTQIREILL